jgi:hypothetical protein
MPDPNFSVPIDGPLFFSTIRERCFELIDSGIWDGIEPGQLRRWLNNFITDEQRYFSACVLDMLIYRSPAQTTALMRQLFERTLPDLSRDKGILSGDEDAWFERLASTGRRDPLIRLVPVIRLTDPPTKSGPVIARLYRRELGLNDRWMIWPWQINEARRKGVNTFLFVDDFLGTGSQFIRFAELFRIRDVLDGATAVYAPLAGHSSSYSRLEREAPWVQVGAVEQLTSAYGLFSNESAAFRDGTNSPQAAKKFYTELVRSRRLRLERRILYGWGRQALTYVFHHSTPNNCIPLLWYPADGWTPLFNR